jgi:hypothetical protein
MVASHETPGHAPWLRARISRHAAAGAAFTRQEVMMLRWMQSGGLGMWFVAAIGAAVLWNAVQFARGADPQRLAVVRALSVVTVVASFTGFVAGLAETCRYVLANPDAQAAPLPALLAGFAESCANLLLAGGVLVAAWAVVAVGVRRMPRERLP